jgi:hypothetical protein
MDQDSITRYIAETFDGIHIDTSTEDTFFFNDPDCKFPFATLVNSDNDYDRASHLDRPSVFRLNIGIGKSTFQSLFGTPDTDYDFTVFDRLLPHPVYGKMFWLCVLNPSSATFQTLRPLLAEAYDLSLQRYVKPVAHDRQNVDLRALR